MDDIISFIHQKIDEAKYQRLLNFDVDIPIKFHMVDYEKLCNLFNNSKTICKIRSTPHKKYLNFTLKEIDHSILYGPEKKLQRAIKLFIENLNRSEFKLNELQNYLLSDHNINLTANKVQNFVEIHFKNSVRKILTKDIFVKNEYYDEYIKKTFPQLYDKSAFNNQYARDVILTKQLRTNCICKHTLKAYIVKIGVLNKHTELVTIFNINANYCLNCNVSYITLVELDSYIKNGNLNYKILADYVLEDSEKIKVIEGRVIILNEGDNKKYGNYREQHEIYKIGYNVSDNLSDTCRLNILNYAIEVYDYETVLRHLQWLISNRKEKKALKKWQTDLENLIDYWANLNGILPGIYDLKNSL